MMKILVLLMGMAFGGLVIKSSGAHAVAYNYPWCANYNMQNGVSNCGFTTLAQCQATVSGIGGFCAANPAYIPPAADRARRARQG
ncbi:MAG TPA: DUF3551 domain-containing protein [Xanthobacteraceae bacterium]|nr:DUF3551 domain-containing protein [Xanthobacteraceae bacterium]